MEILKTCTAIITAAGKGLRLAGDVKKQFRMLDGIPILIRSLSPFFSSPIISNIIVTAPESEVELTRGLIEQYFEPLIKPLLVIPGGVERQDSVFGALQNCPPDTDLVFIHDAVRPFISLELIAELYAITQETGAVVPASRLKNTVKMVEGECIASTVARDRLIQVFTPQVFDFDLLRQSYEKAYQDGYVSTDDSALVEHYGHKVHYLLTSDMNIKITDEWDFTLAHLIIENNIIV